MYAVAVYDFFKSTCHEVHCKTAFVGYLYIHTWMNAEAYNCEAELGVCAGQMCGQRILNTGRRLLMSSIQVLRSIPNSYEVQEVEE